MSRGGTLKRAIKKYKRPIAETAADRASESYVPWTERLTTPSPELQAVLDTITDEDLKTYGHKEEEEDDEPGTDG